MKLKNVLLAGLSFVLVAAIAIGGTLAYLTSEDSDVNVMTLGNVEIEQFEMERVFDANGDVTGMQEFTQAKPLYPAVVTNGTGNAAWQPNSAVDLWYKDYLGDRYPGGNGTWQNLNNVMDKFVFVENTGKSDAYYRTIILLEADETGFQNDLGQGLIHLNVNGHSNFTWSPEDGDVNGETLVVEVDGEKYTVMVATYNVALTPGEISRPSLLQVGMDQMATNEIVEQFGDTYDILVLSQAVQAAGFADAEAALNEGFGEINVANVTAWFEEMLIARNTITATTPEEVLEAFENAQPGMTINAEDVTLVPTGDPNNTVNVPAGVTVKGVTFAPTTSAFLRIDDGEPVVFEDCDFPGGSWATYLIGTDGCKDITFKNCNFEGFLQPNGTDHTDAVFTYENCTFGLSDGTGYVNCMGGTHTFNNCTFDYTGGSTMGSNQYTKWNAVNSYSESAFATTVTLNNCTFVNCTTYRVGPNSTLTVQ